MYIHLPIQEGKFCLFPKTNQYSCDHSQSPREEPHS